MERKKSEKYSLELASIADNYQQVVERVAAAAERVGRRAEEVLVLPVSKTKPHQFLRAAWQAGARDFAENYLQEAQEKMDKLSDLAICWHFIGPLQSNKTRTVAERFDWLHTLARHKIAERLNDQRPDALAPLNVCIQVNISQEENKSGLAKEQVIEFADYISERCPNLLLRGLMAIPKVTIDTQVTRSAFHEMAELFQSLKAHHASVDTLSMGMSGDLALAIEEGSTLVRIGTAIFGERDT